MTPPGREPSPGTGRRIDRSIVRGSIVVALLYTCYLGLVFLYACWLGMEVVHEAGHVIHAVVSGGRVVRVEMPPLGFSRTDVSPNPRPAVVAWGGPTWGVLLPLGAWAACRAAGRPKSNRGRQAVQFFAGFCLVANGAYLGVGWIDRVGDAGDLLRHGTPSWVLVVYGMITTGVGLGLWHRLGIRARAG